MSNKTCRDCGDSNCSSKQKKVNETEQEYKERQKRQQRMCKIKHKILVLSGKGGVGKSTVAVNMAMAFAAEGSKVGLVDADIHGPSIPKMLNLENVDIVVRNDSSMVPAEYGANLKVMSVGFFLENQDTAIIWRGPKKYSLIKQFLEDVEWGELDYLIFDLPPGTGDEPLAICQLIEDVDGAVIVTTPQDVAITDVRKSITFCKHLNLKVLGVVENMSGFQCPKCGKIIDIFGKGGAEKMSKSMNVNLLGSIPVNPEIVKNGDLGKPFIGYSSNDSADYGFRDVIVKIKSVLK